MKQQTRDNLTYLAVGLGLAALLAFDAFYSDSHNRKMWMPSRFAFNAVAFMGVLVLYGCPRDAEAKGNGRSDSRMRPCCVFVTFWICWRFSAHLF
jgi:hypothetical protein